MKRKENPMKKSMLKLLTLTLSIATLMAFSSMGVFADANASAAQKPKSELLKAVEKLQGEEGQKFTDHTYKDCENAKALFDKLTDTQKKSLEKDDPDVWDYFMRDTGDASKDDTLNADNIGKTEILVASFGTSFNQSRAATIGAVERRLQQAYKNMSVRRGFTAQIIINHVYARDGKKIDNIVQAIERAKKNNVNTLIIQPTHLMHGAEYDELKAAVKAKEKDFSKVVISEPLLTTKDDMKTVAKGIASEAAKMEKSGVRTVTSKSLKKTAFVFMGHGTAHVATKTYIEMQKTFKKLKYNNVFVGTVEGKPASTERDVLIKKIKKAGYKKVVLRPLMVVAGDHANNDMAGDDDDSWKPAFEKAFGGAQNVSCQIHGLGEIKAVRNLYVKHMKDALGATEGIVKNLKIGQKKITVKVAKAPHVAVVKSTAAKISTVAKPKFELKYKAKGSGKYKTVKLSSSKKVLKKLKTGKKYIFKVRSFVNVDGTKYFSAWGTAKTSKAVK